MNRVYLILVNYLSIAACSADGTKHLESDASHTSVYPMVPDSGLPPPKGTGGTTSRSDAGTSSALEVHVERPSGLTVTVITVECSGKCADVVAVASGGVAPYTFAWEDGSTDPHRHVCPTSSTSYEVSATDMGIHAGEFAVEPETVRVSLTADVLACPDAGAVADRPCPSGDTAKGDPVGGTVTYFRQGGTIPAGRYRVSYLDGCMRYGPAVNWSIHNILPPGWLLLGNTALDQLGVLPGVSGTGYASFEDCVAASRRLPPLEVDFAGGKLGVWNNDYPLSDNIAGLNGRDPEWCLTPL